MSRPRRSFSHGSFAAMSVPGRDMRDAQEFYAQWEEPHPWLTGRGICRPVPSSRLAEPVHGAAVNEAVRMRGFNDQLDENIVSLGEMQGAGNGGGWSDMGTSGEDAANTDTESYSHPETTTFSVLPSYGVFASLALVDRPSSQA